ncbi:MAG: hypothetical protein ACREVX_14785 [Clostridium sp.]|uniref:hypothetical protein n=1 Tax=Clostridium sp. TaxID=1506 RepID=UPI003D6D7384
MVTFKKMWNDVLLLLSNDEYVDIDILEKFNFGFTVKDNDNIIFNTKNDFSIFWCNLLYYNELSLNQVLGNNKLSLNKILGDDKLKPKYIYTIIKHLPYISDSSGVIKLIQ